MIVNYDRQTVANMKITNKEGLTWLSRRLNSITSDDSFRHSDLYRLLRDELTRLGHWKAKQRGNSKQGYRVSPIAQQVSDMRRLLNEYRYNDSGGTASLTKMVEKNKRGGIPPTGRVL